MVNIKLRNKMKNNEIFFFIVNFYIEFLLLHHQSHLSCMTHIFIEQLVCLTKNRIPRTHKQSVRSFVHCVPNHKISLFNLFSIHCPN
jgi:hypothetical protein